MRPSRPDGSPRPDVSEKDGVPRCSHMHCPKYNIYSGVCSEIKTTPTLVCIPAVIDMVIELDARKDAADPAFQEIVELCGLAKTWEYPGQVVRDVADTIKGLRAKIAVLEACVVYARDRRGSSFDFDEWTTQVQFALEGRQPLTAVENAQTKEAQAWAAVESIRLDRDSWRQRELEAKQKVHEIREERDADLHVMSRQGTLIEELREKLRIAEAVRDDARAASQRYLDEKRELQKWCEERKRTYGFCQGCPECLPTARLERPSSPRSE